MRNIDNEVLLTQLENFVRKLPDDSKIFEQLDYDSQEKATFEFFPGHSGAIYGFMEAMKEIVSRPVPLQLQVRPQSTQSSSASSSSRFQLTTANAASYLRTKLISRLKGSVPSDSNLIIIQSRTDSFPYSFKVQCFNCDHTSNVTISQDNRAPLIYNIRATKFTDHVKGCMQSNS